MDCRDHLPTSLGSTCYRLLGCDVGLPARLYTDHRPKPYSLAIGMAFTLINGTFSGSRADPTIKIGPAIRSGPYENRLGFVCISDPF
jgi:hypothetical protein